MLKLPIWVSISSAIALAFAMEATIEFDDRLVLGLQPLLQNALADDQVLAPREADQIIGHLVRHRSVFEVAEQRGELLLVLAELAPEEDADRGRRAFWALFLPDDLWPSVPQVLRGPSAA